MKRHRLLVAAALLGLSAPLLATGTSSLVQAQGYDSDRPDSRYPDSRSPDSRNNQGYPQFPRVQGMRRVAYLAQAVEVSAVRLEHNTFNRRTSLNGQERRAMTQIRALTGAASHFRAQVQSFQRDPAHTQADFERLVRAFYIAGRALDDVDASGAARSAYDTLRGRMDELMRSYGGASRWTQYNTPDPSHHGPPSNGPYDR